METRTLADKRRDQDWTMVEILEYLPLLGFFGLALFVSFLCSLLEAVFLSVSHGHIEALIKKGHKAGERLKNLKEHTDRALAAILTLNTIAHTIGAVGVGAEVLKLWGDGYVAITSAVLTLLILIFSEVIPKSIGAAKWKRLAPFAATTIRIFIGLTFWITPLLERISKVFQPDGFQAEVTREEMIAVAEIGQNQGALEADETRVIRNLLRLDNIPVEDVMTPSTVMLTFGKGQTVEQVLEEHSPIPFSRIPVIDRDLDDVVGVALRSELLEAVSEHRETTTMAELAHPLETVTPDDSVGAIFDKFIAKRDHIFLVVDEYGTTQGLVTLEDAIETLLGVEIVDESDSVDDMRQLAREQWESRRKAKDLVSKK